MVAWNNTESGNHSTLMFCGWKHTATLLFWQNIHYELWILISI